jgi:hypothetical protein
MSFYDLNHIQTDFKEKSSVFASTSLSLTEGFVAALQVNQAGTNAGKFNTITLPRPHRFTSGGSHCTGDQISLLKKQALALVIEEFLTKALPHLNEGLS